MMTVDEALRHERDRLPFELEMVSIDAMETLAAEVRRLRHQWSYYQDFCKQNGFDGITAMAVAVDKLREENERQRFDILAMNQSLDLMREENERLRKDAERYRWLIDQHWIQSEVDWRLIPTHQESTIEQLSKAIDAARGAK